MIVKYSKMGRWYEKDVAKSYNGKTQTGSGCHWAAKGDIKTSKYLIETKFTTKDSYVLHYQDLINLFNYAYREGKTPLFQIGFYGGQEFVIVEDLEERTSWDINVKPGAKSKTLNKHDLPQKSTMLYNRLKLLIINKKTFDNEQKISDTTD